MRLYISTHRRSSRSPSDQQELPHQTLPPHGHQYASDRHALAEAGHHPGLGQVASQLLQQLVKVVLPRVAVDLIRVGDADSILRRHVFECLHSTLAVVTCGGGRGYGSLFISLKLTAQTD